jgi:hypothetical protein
VRTRHCFHLFLLLLGGYSVLGLSLSLSLSLWREEDSLIEMMRRSRREVRREMMRMGSHDLFVVVVIVVSK